MMGKYSLVSLAFCTIATMQGMDKEAQAQALTLPDLHNIQKALHNDYRSYLTDQLELYKTANSFSPSYLISAAHIIQGIDAGPDYYPNDPVAQDILTTRDDQGNHFIHIGVERGHKGVVETLAGMRAHATTMRNNNGETALDVCIKKMPADKGYSPTQLEILEVLLYRTAHLSRQKEEYKAVLEASLKKVVLLQLDYKKLGKELPLRVDHLLKLIKFNASKEEKEKELAIALLSKSYQHAADEANGETFTHVLVQQELPDELFEWIKQERVSLAENNAGKTAVDIALERFRQVALKSPARGNDSFTNKRCCLFMLLKYCHIKNGTNFNNCCDKHVLS